MGSSIDVRRRACTDLRRSGHVATGVRGFFPRRFFVHLALNAFLCYFRRPLSSLRLLLRLRGFLSLVRIIDGLQATPILIFFLRAFFLGPWFRLSPLRRRARSGRLGRDR
jgi:hypothetical protein